MLVTGQWQTSNIPIKIAKKDKFCTENIRSGLFFEKDSDEQRIVNCGFLAGT